MPEVLRITRRVLLGLLSSSFAAGWVGGVERPQPPVPPQRDKSTFAAGVFEEDVFQ